MTRKKKIEYHSYIEGTIRYMSCMTCGRYEAVGELATGVRCSRCVNMIMMKNYPLETKLSYVSTGRPPGWHFMKEYVDKDGNVFHRGKEVPKLKGTLSATKVKPLKKRKIKRQTKEQMLVARHKEKKAELRKAVKKQKDFLDHKFGDKNG